MLLKWNLIDTWNSTGWKWCLYYISNHFCLRWHDSDINQTLFGIKMREIIEHNICWHLLPIRPKFNETLHVYIQKTFLISWDLSRGGFCKHLSQIFQGSIYIILAWVASKVFVMVLSNHKKLPIMFKILVAVICSITLKGYIFSILSQLGAAISYRGHTRTTYWLKHGNYNCVPRSHYKTSTKRELNVVHTKYC